MMHDDSVESHLASLSSGRRTSLSIH